MIDTLIVDYGLCNLDSVKRAVEECGGKALISDDPAAIESAGKIILPGVGSFSDAAANMGAKGWDTALRKAVLKDKLPFLGICLGMQLMATRGSEGAAVDGLGLIPGHVVRLKPQDQTTRIPHVGWNAVDQAKGHALFTGIPKGKDFYFTHSYHYIPDSAQDIAATTDYCGGFVSAVTRENRIFGVQFHPEKSQRAGLQLIKNFISQC